MRPNAWCAKCGGMARATAPMLLHKGSVETLIAMARQADASLRQEFGVPLGLIVIDTNRGLCRLCPRRRRE